MAGALALRVVTPGRVAVEAEASEVTVPAVLGTLGILPGHAPLLAALRIGELTYRDARGMHHLAIQRGFVEVSSDRVTVLADVAEHPSEIDVEAAEIVRAEAEAALKSASDGGIEEERARLEAAVTRIAVASRV